jgi:hypothetical protein
MSITITSPTAGTVLASNTTSVTVQGTSIQSVNGTALPSQTFSVNVDVSKSPPGPLTLQLLNSSGEVAKVLVQKQTPESVAGTIIVDSTALITDANGDQWNIMGGVAAKNGVAVGTRTVSKLYYQNHTVWETDGTNWWYYAGNPWQPGTGPVSASGTALTSDAGVINDANGNAWTLFNTGTSAAPNYTVYENGAAAAFTSQVTTLLYYNGTIYQSNSAGGWWSWSGTAWVTATGDPRTASTPSAAYPAAPYYGVNGHMTWANPAGYKEANWPNNASAMLDLGMTTYRNGYGATYSSTDGSIVSSDSGSFLRFMNANPGITVFPVLLPQYMTDWTGAKGTESSAYTIGYNLGRDCALALKGRVPWYEVGNEFDGSYWSTNIGWDNASIVSGSGFSKTNFNNTKYLICRGSILGMIAGIRSVDTKTPIAWPGGTWVHLGFFQCLMDGSTPAATTTYDTTKIPTFQIKAWHWYVNGSTSNDPITNCQGQGIPNNDFMAALNGVGPKLPLIISEFGVNTTNTSTGASMLNNTEYSTVAQGLTSAGLLMDKFLAIRNSYAGMPIIAIQLYQLADAYANQANPNLTTDYTAINEMGFGLTAQDGITKKAQYAAVKAFVAANPVAATVI